jgi:hypothetical protein
MEVVLIIVIREEKQQDRRGRGSLTRPQCKHYVCEVGFEFLNQKQKEKQIGKTTEINRSLYSKY